MSTPPKSHEFTLGQALNQALAGSPLQKKWDAERIIAHWAEFAGPALARHTEKVWIRHHVLYLKMDGAVWKNELLYIRSEIAGRINAQIGQDLIQDVRIL